VQSFPSTFANSINSLGLIAPPATFAEATLAPEGLAIYRCSNSQKETEKMGSVENIFRLSTKLKLDTALYKGKEAKKNFVVTSWYKKYYIYTF